MKKERMSEEGIRNNFSYSIALIRRSLADIGRKTMLYAVAVRLPDGTVHAEARRSRQPPYDHPYRGLSIGGWVFLWEAFSLLFFAGQETSNQLKRPTPAIGRESNLQVPLKRKRKPSTRSLDLFAYQPYLGLRPRLSRVSPGTICSP